MFAKEMEETNKSEIILTFIKHKEMEISFGVQQYSISTNAFYQ